MCLALSSQGPSKSLQFQYYYPSLGFEDSCELKAKHIKNLKNLSDNILTHIKLIFP